MKFLLGFCLILGVIVALFVSYDKFMWGATAFLVSFCLLLMDDSVNYHKFDYKG